MSSFLMLMTLGRMSVSLFVSTHENTSADTEIGHITYVI